VYATNSRINKTAFKTTEFVLDVATLANDVKSISNIDKNLSWKISIGQLSLSEIDINLLYYA